MSEDGCDRIWQVGAYRAGVLGAREAESFERHSRACTTCRARLESDDRLRDLARALPDPEPTELGLRRLRRRILHDAGGGDRLERRLGRRRWVAVGVLVMLAASAGLAALLAVPRRGLPPPRASSAEERTAPAASVDEVLAGSVVGAPAARWSQARMAHVERVELAEGSIRVRVRPQLAGERFLVELPDGEIEVRGTSFDVDVERGATRLVYVADGVVELRLNGRDTVRLGPSESWPPPSDVGRSPIAAQPIRPLGAHEPAASTPLASPTGSMSPSSSTGGEDRAIAYADAVQRLRTGRYDEAASRLHAFILSNPDLPQAEDASFLEAVALARAGRVDAAALAAEHHLARYPHSFHAREAALFVARAASQRHDCDKARAAIAPWTNNTAGADVFAALGSCRAEGSRPESSD